MKKKMMLLMVFVLSVLPMSGCLIVSTPGGEGAAKILWSFGGALACPADVDSVVVQIDGLADRVVPCTNGQTHFEGLQEGSYTVVLKGIEQLPNGADEITWQSSVRSFTVLSGSVVDVSIDLAPGD